MAKARIELIVGRVLLEIANIRSDAIPVGRGSYEPFLVFKAHIYMLVRKAVYEQMGFTVLRAWRVPRPFPLHPWSG